MPKHHTTYRCKRCKSKKVQGTLPAWFEVNKAIEKPVDIDYEASFQYGYCPACEESGHFDEIAEEV